MIYKLTFRGEFGSVCSGKLSRWDKKENIPASKVLYGFNSITFLVHGFNVGKQEGETSLSELADRLYSSTTEAIVFILWPGDSPIGPLSYPFSEGYQAIDTASQLHHSIQDHVAPGTHLNFVAHSLGNRVVLETIENLHKSSNNKNNRYIVKQVCLMAAAVDDYCMSNPNQYKAAVKTIERLVVLSSVNDNVLKYIYPLGDLVQSFIYFWKETFGFALGYRGPVSYFEEFDIWDDDEEQVIEHTNPKNVKHEAIAKGSKVDHGDYLPSEQINNKQIAAAQFVNAVITGEKELKYKIIT